MALYKAQVIIPNDNGLPEDSVVNGFHFDSNSILTEDYDNIRDMLSDLYTGTADDQTNPLSYYYSGLYGGPATVKLYDMGDPTPRIPVYTGFFTFAPPTDVPALPAEVAVVLSFGATPSSGEPPARRRNRVYLGPFNERANNGDARVSTALITDLSYAAKGFVNASNSSVIWKWVGFSPTDNEQFDIVGGWIDNAFDTQRRRGLSPTARTIFSSGAPA